MFVLLRDRIQELVFKLYIRNLLECFKVDPVLGVHAIAQLYEGTFCANVCLVKFSYNFTDRIVMRAPEYTSMNRGGPFVFAEVRVLFWRD